MSGTTFGRKWINKSGQIKYVMQSELQNYLNNGWEIGKGGLVQSTTSLNKKWVHNPNTKKTKYAEQHELDNLLNSGWRLGRRIVEIPKKEIIQKIYEEKGTKGICDFFKISKPTAHSWLKEYDIQYKSHSENMLKSCKKERELKLPSKSTLLDLYEKHSIKDLEDIFSVGQNTIYEWLDKLNIERKTLSDACFSGKSRSFEKNFRISKEKILEVYNEYRNIGKTLQILDMSYAVFKKLRKEYEIETDLPWRSLGEIDLYEFLKENDPDGEWIHSDQNILPGRLEIDMVSFKRNLAIEYCGIVPHSELGYKKPEDCVEISDEVKKRIKGKYPKFHLHKLENCEKQGIKLLTVFETDDINKIKDSLLVSLGKCEKIYARNCILKEIDRQTLMDFTNENHLQNHIEASVKLGLYFNDELVQIMSFGKSRHNISYEWEIYRLATKRRMLVVGGASKLFKHFIKTYNPKSIISYCDRRFSIGNVYEKIGMNLLQTSHPSYFYFKQTKSHVLYSRNNYKKQYLKDKLENFYPELSEWKNMKINGFNRIWDCGEKVYVWNKPK